MLLLSGVANALNGDLGRASIQPLRTARVLNSQVERIPLKPLRTASSLNSTLRCLSI